MKNGIELIAEERARQIEKEGWTAQHDEINSGGELAAAAACYALNASGYQFPEGVKLPMWPWSLEWWKPTTPTRDLVKAGALIAAEIDRRNREEANA